MARTRGIFNFSANLEVKKNAPLDARIVVDTILELTSTSTWEDSDNKVWLYNGIVVSVIENNGLYMLTNYDPVDNATAYTEAENWVQLDATAAKIDIQDRLDSTSTTSALSANQGKILNEKIEGVKSSLSSIYSYKGSVDNYTDLPSSDQKVGDTYNVVNANGDIPAGTNYAWDGEAWDPLGGSIDLSGYATKTEVTQEISESLETVTGNIGTLQSQVNANTEALNVINGADSTSGSLAYNLKVSKEYTDTQLLNYVQKVEGSSLITEEKLQLIDTNASEIESLKTQVKANTAAISLLNNTKETAGSVLYMIDQSINNALSWNEI